MKIGGTGMETRKRCWQLGVGVLIGVVVLGAAQGARALLDDSNGKVPPDAGTLKCESGVANNLSKLRACDEKCHIKGAAAALAGKTFDEEACETTDPVKSCRAQFVAKTTSCTPCLGNVGDLAFQVEGGLDRPAGTVGSPLSGALFCAGSTPLPGEDLGVVPPDAATLKCESGVANSISKLEQCINKCQVKAAAAALAGKTFDEEACEKSPAKSCLAQYNASVAKLVGCPACLDATQQANLAVAAEFDLDSSRGAIYCAGSTPF